MAKKSRYGTQTRDAGGFIALPWAVIDSPAYMSLSPHAKVLLIEFARQLRGDNNGMLLCSRAYMSERGWKSNDMLTKCRDELLSAKLIHQTVLGHRPNRASWYAVTWIGLDKLNGYDADLSSMFVRGSYRASTIKTQSLSRPTGQESGLLHRPTGQEKRPLSRPTGLSGAIS
ncbi:MAG: hypothetical protein WKG52_01040 [Variovorax sp.]